MNQTSRRFDYRRHQEALEVLRQEGGLLTMVEALERVDSRRAVAVRAETRARCAAQARDARFEARS